MFRIIKMVVGASLVAYGMYSGNNWFYLGLLPLVMGICNKCPLGGCKDGACGIDNNTSCCSTETKKEETPCCSSDTECCSNENDVKKTMSFSANKPSSESCCSNDITNIKILGTGCANCVTLYNNVNKAIEDLNCEFEVSKVEDLEEIMKYQVINTPALVINEVVKSTGKVLSIEEIQDIISGTCENSSDNTKCCGN